MDIIKIFIIFIIPFVSSSYDYNRQQQLRIVGGIDADPNSAPYIVSFLVKDRRRQLIPFCAGSLLSESWVLTAAHCLVLDPRRIHVAAGHHNQDEFEDTTQFRRADYHIQHENFNDIGPYDIGLLHVSRPFQMTPQVQQVVLSGIGKYTGYATLYGWGSLLPNRRRQFPSILQTANLTLVENNYCQSIFPIEINEGNLCAGLPTLGKGGCVGDSGGPLMQDGLQIGIISWGPITCNPVEGPSVFTKVSYYLSWIEQQLEQTTEIEKDHDEEHANDDDDEYYFEHDFTTTDNIIDFTTTTIETETESNE